MDNKQKEQKEKPVRVYSEHSAHQIIENDSKKDISRAITLGFDGSVTIQQGQYNDTLRFRTVSDFTEHMQWYTDGMVKLLTMVDKQNGKGTA